uniref:Uncharacterized protein n=1 Tax=Anguilla anguilla TaxID=7936 RepID=A0A0E9WP64_ANGAN
MKVWLSDFHTVNFTLSVKLLLKYTKNTGVSGHFSASLGLFCLKGLHDRTSAVVSKLCF